MSVLSGTRSRGMIARICLYMALVVAVSACDVTAPEQLGLTITSSGDGVVTAPGEGSFRIEAGSVVSLKADPGAGSAFVRWSGDVETVADATSASTTIIMDDDYSIVAVFEPMGHSALPDPPAWNPGRQALLPSRSFDANWTSDVSWFRALHRGLSALWAGDPMIASPSDANVSTMLGLSAGHPVTGGSWILRYVFSKDRPGGTSLDLIVRLYDGETLLEEWVESDIPAAWTERNREVHQRPHALDDLRVELARQGDVTVAEPELRRVLVSLVEMELPYPDVFDFPYLNPATTTHAPGSDVVLRPGGIREGDLIFVTSVGGEPAEGFNLILSNTTPPGAAHPVELRTWWKRAGPAEPASYRFPNADGLWAARVSGAADLAPVAAGHAAPPHADDMLPLGVATPSVEASRDNSLVIRISANNLYRTWTEPHQWLAWADWPAFAGSWQVQKQAGQTGEEHHGTGSFIYWVAQTVVIAPQR